MKRALAVVCAVVAITGAVGDVSAARLVQASRQRIPPITSLTEGRAREQLKGRGFTGKVIVQITSPSLECPPGHQGLLPGLVCASIPGHVDEIPSDSEITLLIQGEYTVDDPFGFPPRVIGMSRNEAVKGLTAERFTNVEYQFVDSGTCAAKTVCGLLSRTGSFQQKPDGTISENNVPARNEPLRLQIGTAHPRGANRLDADMIDIVGDTLDVALAKLDAFGVRGPIRIWRGACPQETTGIESGRICAQRPPAGQRTSGLAVEYAIVGQRQ